MQEDYRLLAILGPTNTGKTHTAFDRLMSYRSGIFGFPLRLLARENYDKAVKRLGLEKIALLTGEEKIIPKNAKYFFCTVESMPLNIDIECVIVDEVQLAANYDRGHIFTDRILNLRGTFETIFLGSLTFEKILLNLFPKIKIEKLDRLSKLTFLNKKSISKLEPRSAIIAFNINSVYEIAESLRMHRGGAAVVLGSLSPRTRNAQVQVYEEKKVDFLVATDAIGMGLNLNINHVSFSSLQKFDGRYTRDLSASELAQIAGRAGRYHNDGTFGNLKNAGKLDSYLIQSIENHSFDNIQKIYWRNSNIDFSSVESVVNSFKQSPIKNFFIHKKNAEDEVNFNKLSKDSNIIPYLNNSRTINLLWEICCIPDFQNIFNNSYIELLKNIFLTLIKNDGILDDNWLLEKIIRLENYDGGIDELSIKIANIRTWTYIANQSGWIKDAKYWQNKTQNIENKLSDCLHLSLTKRFIDFSSSFFLDNKNQGTDIKIDIDEKKSIKLNGKNYGYINGFDLKLHISNAESLFFLNNVKKSIRIMIEEKINNFINAPSDSLNLGDISKVQLNENVNIYWGDEPIGIIKKGINIFSPKAEVLSSEFLESNKKIIIQKKMQEWLDAKITIVLKPITESLDNIDNAEVRLIIFNVFNQLGTMLNKDYYNVIKKLNINDKSIISRIGIRIGVKFFFIPNFLKKISIELNAILWNVFNQSKLDGYYPLPSDGRVSFISEIKMPESYWLSIGYICINNFAIRVDVFEKIFFLARNKIKYGPFLESADLMNSAGCNSNQLKDVLKFCGFDSVELTDDKKLFFYKPIKKRDNTKKIKTNTNKIIKLKKTAKKKANFIKVSKNIIKKEGKTDPNSPFAVLEKLL